MVLLRPAPHVARPAVIALASLTVALSSASCQCTKTENGSADGAAATSAPSVVQLDERYEGSGADASVVIDGSRRFLDASPRVELDRDGPVDAVCTGAEVAFAVAVVDRRCAIGSGRAKALRAALERDGGAPIPLRQEGKVEADGRVTLRLVNTGEAPLVLPLSWSAKLPSFTVLAEDQQRSIYELAPPRFEVSRAAEAVGADASVGNERAYFARIVLPPGGAAVGTITVDPAIAKALRRAGDSGAERCADGGVCPPSRLGKGKYVLHIGELLTDVEAGSPAQVVWEP
jgi:hypothetical protein